MTTPVWDQYYPGGVQAQLAHWVNAMRTATGPKGPPGNTGPQGVTGRSGPVGSRGDVGQTGMRGPTGHTGPKGA